jgi:NADPH:quinone reductase-like Zn-dependent oxidoreductase
MKAMIWTAYGPPEVLQLQEIDRPSPEEDQLLIKIHAATVTAGDCETRSLNFPLWLSLPMRIFAGLRKPTRIKIIGQEMAGEIVEIGNKVTKYKVGDPVFGSLGLGQGAYAQHISLPEIPGEMDGVLTKKPSNLSFQEAAALPIGGLESHHFLKLADIQPGEKVLINGAGGSIGTIGIQLAKLAGGVVTAVDRGDKLELLLSLGADQVINYQTEDFTASGEEFDVIFDVVGKAPFDGCVRSLTPTGRYLIANPRLTQYLRRSWLPKVDRQKVFIGASSPKTGDLIYLKELVEQGKLKVIIDREYPLEEVPLAHHYVESGAKKGNVVISINHED